MYRNILARLLRLFGKTRHSLDSTQAEIQLMAQLQVVLGEEKLLRNSGIACGGRNGI